MNAHKFTLSDGAQTIFKNVLDAMQHADEFGDIASKEDYICLMAAIIHECSQRIDTALA